MSNGRAIGLPVSTSMAIDRTTWYDRKSGPIPRLTRGTHRTRCCTAVMTRHFPQCWTWSTRDTILPLGLRIEVHGCRNSAAASDDHERGSPTDRFPGQPAGHLSPTLTHGGPANLGPLKSLLATKRRVVARQLPHHGVDYVCARSAQHDKMSPRRGDNCPAARVTTANITARGLSRH
jgi:hypothetical protein